MTSKVKKPSAETIEGDAVEKPASAGSSGQHVPPPVSENAGVSAGIVTAVAVAFISAAIALFSLYQSQNQAMPTQDTARQDIDALGVRLAALEQRVDESQQADATARRDLETKLSQQITALPLGDGTDDDIAQRLAGLADRLGQIEARIPEQAMTTSAVSTSSSAREAGNISQAGNSAPVAGTDSNGMLSRVSSQPAQPETVLSHASLVAVSGLLADNMAGRPVKQWHDILQTLVQKGALDFDMESLSAMLAQNPPSRVALLDDADQVIADMADVLHGKDLDESLMGQAASKIGKLVNLRPTDLAADSPAGQLAAFEAAVTARDFDAALRAAQDWRGDDVSALREWQAAAMARQQLDAAIMQLVAVVLADMAEAG
ncbi:MAG: hypothetical protein ACPID7_00290 [Candidatus Puniceispirillum sp.]